MLGLFLVIGCGDTTPNPNVCGELGNQPCCPGTSRPQGVICTSAGAFCTDPLVTFTCSCQGGTWSCHDASVRDLSVPDLSSHD